MSQVTVESLLKAVSSLPSDLQCEFDDRYALTRLSQAKDEILIERTKQKLPRAEDLKLRSLVAKSEAGKLTKKDWESYRMLAQKAERLTVMRLEALAELARRRGKSLEEMMEEVGWESAAHGT